MTLPRLACAVAAGTKEVALHHRIRHQVFVDEQGVFSPSDTDGRDAEPDTIKVLGWADDIPAGAVRLYRLDGEGRWQGDRLAVLPPYRAYGLGRPLVRFAVTTAARLGGTEMVAHVQVANVRFFERLGWAPRGDPETYVGLPHQLMAIDLTGVALEQRAPGTLRIRG